MGPYIAVSVDLADHGDLRQERISDLFLPALVREKGLEPVVLAPGLLQPRFQDVELPDVIEIDQPETRDHYHPCADGGHEERILHFGRQLAQSAELVHQALQRITAALPLLARP